MKKVIISVILCLGVLSCKTVTAQTLKGSIQGGYVYVPQDPNYFKDGLLLTGSIENFFSDFFSLGISAKFGVVAYQDEHTSLVNEIPEKETELDVSNFVYHFEIKTILMTTKRRVYIV